MNGPATLDLTPTWAGLLPALVAMLQNGKGEGPAIARAELLKLCQWADSHNAEAKAGAADLARRAAALDLARSALGAYPPADLAPGIALGAVKLRGIASDLRESLAGLVAAFDPAPAPAASPSSPSSN